MKEVAEDPPDLLGDRGIWRPPPSEVCQRRGLWELLGLSICRSRELI